MENNLNAESIYNKAYQEGYMAAKKNDEKIILNLQKIITSLRESIEEMRDEQSVNYRY